MFLAFVASGALDRKQENLWKSNFQMMWIEQIEKCDDKHAALKGARNMPHKSELMEIQESRITIRVPAYTYHDGE